MGHPLRWGILVELERRETATAADLSADLSATRAAVAHHLRVLEECGAVERVAAKEGGGRAVAYRALMRPRVFDEDWARFPLASRRAIIGQDLRRIARDAATAFAHGGFDRADANVSRIATTLDRPGHEEMTALLIEVVDRALAIQAGAVERRASDPDGDTFAGQVVVLNFLRGDDPDAEGVPELPQASRTTMERMYAILDGLAEELPEAAPDWQRVSEMAFTLAALAQQHGAVATER